MTRSADYVCLRVGGERLDTWTSYRVDSDILQPADGFELTVEVGARADQLSQDRFARYREACSPGSLVELYVGDDVTGQRRDRYLQLTGRIDDLEVTNSRTRGTVLHVTGRDSAAYLVDSSVPVGLVREEGTSFVDLVQASVQPWGIEVITDATASRDILTGRHLTTSQDRLRIEEARAQGVPVAGFSRALRRRAEREGRPVDEALGTTASDRTRRRTSNGLLASDVRRVSIREAAPRAGETVWEFLSRHAERLGLMLWMDPRGRLIVGAPRYDQEPLYRFVRRWRNRSDDPNTIIDGGRRITWGDRFSEVVVYGRTRGQDVSRSQIRASVTDSAIPFQRRLVVHDNSIRTVEEAERRAQREVAKRLANVDTLDYELPDHGLGRYLYAIDTIASVDDEPTGASGAWYVTRRTFSRSRTEGTRTRVRLVPRGAIQL